MLAQAWVDLKIVGSNFSNKLSERSHSEGKANIWPLRMETNTK